MRHSLLGGALASAFRHDSGSRSTEPAEGPDNQLRHDKGIVVAELLTELSLSPDAYEELKAGAPREAVKTLSRLHRYCLKHGMEGPSCRSADSRDSGTLGVPSNATS